MRALRNADAATHACIGIDRFFPVVVQNRVKLAILRAGTADDTARIVHLCHISGRRKHRSSVPMRLHCTATTGTAIADGIESTEHRIFEKRMMHVPSFVFRFKDINSFGGSDFAGSIRMMLQYEPCKRFSDDEAHIHRQAGLPSRVTARAFEYGDLARILQHDIARRFVRYDVLKIAKFDIPVNRNDVPRLLNGNYFTVVRISKRQHTFPTVIVSPIQFEKLGKRRCRVVDWAEQSCEEVFARSDGDVEIGKSKIQVTVEEVEQ